MTLAAAAPVSGNQTAIWVVLAIVTVFAIVAVLWQHETESDRHRRVINEHDDTLAWLEYQMEKLLEELGVEIEPPAEDDSPEAMADVDQATEERDLGDRAAPTEPDTDEFPALPSTEPMALIADPTPAVQARRDAAWDEQRPSPVPREPAYVTREVNIGGTVRTFRIPVSREDA